MPAWRAAELAFDYVHGFVELKVAGWCDNLSEEEDKAAAIQSSLKTLIGFVVDSMPAEQADRVRARLQRSYVAALINGVLQARTMHERIEHEAKALREAEKIKRAITQARRWGWRFTHPEHTIRGVGEPHEPIETPSYREPAALKAGAPLIAAEHENWIAENYYEAADFRIFIAKKRFALVGVTRQIGSDEKGWTEASVRHGVGKMALEVLQRAPGFDLKRRPLATKKWKRLVADMANPVFDREDITEKEIGDWLVMRLKVEQERDRIKAEKGWWWGY